MGHMSQNQRMASEGASTFGPFVQGALNHSINNYAPIKTYGQHDTQTAALDLSRCLLSFHQMSGGLTAMLLQPPESHGNTGAEWMLVDDGVFERLEKKTARAEASVETGVTGTTTGSGAGGARRGERVRKATLKKQAAEEASKKQLEEPTFSESGLEFLCFVATRQRKAAFVEGAFVSLVPVSLVPSPGATQVGDGVVSLMESMYGLTVEPARKAIDPSTLLWTTKSSSASEAAAGAVMINSITMRTHSQRSCGVDRETDTVTCRSSARLTAVRVVGEDCSVPGAHGAGLSFPGGRFFGSIESSKAELVDVLPCGCRRVYVLTVDGGLHPVEIVKDTTATPMQTLVGQLRHIHTESDASATLPTDKGMPHVSVLLTDDRMVTLVGNVHATAEKNHDAVVKLLGAERDENKDEDEDESKSRLKDPAMRCLLHLFRRVGVDVTTDDLAAELIKQRSQTRLDALRNPSDGATNLANPGAFQSRLSSSKTSQYDILAELAESLRVWGGSVDGLLHKETRGGFMAFMTAESIAFSRELAIRDDLDVVFYVDATHHIVRGIFLITVLVLDGNQGMIPLASALTSTTGSADYERVFKMVLENIKVPGWNPSVVVADMDESIAVASNAVFGVQPRKCTFHVSHRYTAVFRSKAITAFMVALRDCGSIFSFDTMMVVALLSTALASLERIESIVDEGEQEEARMAAMGMRLCAAEIFSAIKAHGPFSAGDAASGGATTDATMSSGAMTISDSDGEESGNEEGNAGAAAGARSGATSTWREEQKARKLLVRRPGSNPVINAGGTGEPVDKPVEQMDAVVDKMRAETAPMDVEKAGADPVVAPGKEEVLHGTKEAAMEASMAALLIHSEDWQEALPAKLEEKDDDHDDDDDEADDDEKEEEKEKEEKEEEKEEKERR